MRILILSDSAPPYSPGGAGRIAYTQAQAFREMGHDVLLLTTRQQQDIPQIDHLDGVDLHRIHVNYPERWRAYLSLYNPAVLSEITEVLDLFRPKIVHAHNVHTYLTYHSFAMIKQRNIPLVLTCHDVMPVAYGKLNHFIDPSDENIPGTFDYRINSLEQAKRQRLRYFPLRNMFTLRAIRKHVNVLLTPSQALMDALISNGVSAQRMDVLPNGINHADFDVAQADIKAFIDSQNLQGRKIILFPGRINQAKGANQLLKALPLIADRVPDAMLLILAKPGGYGEHMTVFAESAGLRQYTQFAGWLSGKQLAASFHAATVCAVPSVYLDPFPTVNLEAQSVGTPVVGTCFGGTPEAIKDGETGYIVNPYHVSLLAERCIQLLTDDVLQQQMSQAAKEHARSRFDWLKQGQKIVEIYEQLI